MIFFCFTQTIYAEQDTPSKPLLTSVLNLSPDDINQLLSDLDTHKHSLIPYTSLTAPFLIMRYQAKKIKDVSGLSLSMAYSSLIQYSAQSEAENIASGGDYDYFGRWLFLNTDKHVGMIGFNLEQRRKYTNYYPAEFNHLIDSFVKTTSGFDTQDFAITELWWASA